MTRKSLLSLLVVVTLPLSAWAAETGDDWTDTDTSEDTSDTSIVPCRTDTLPNGTPIWCDDGTRCMPPAGARQGTVQECHPEGWPPRDLPGTGETTDTTNQG